MKLIWIHFYYFYKIEDNTKVLEVFENAFAQNGDKHLVLPLISLTNFAVSTFFDIFTLIMLSFAVKSIL
jgi:hypothetical protein